VSIALFHADCLEWLRAHAARIAAGEAAKGHGGLFSLLDGGAA